jgi:enoyl-[acyl-carrier protein] reductase II
MESSAHESFKKKIVDVEEGGTQLTLKELAPVRLVKNKFYEDLQHLYEKCPTKEELTTFLGRARAKRGMFEGDLIDGELEIGQIAGLIHQVSSSEEIIMEMMTDFEKARKEMLEFDL